jgi:hypothetical protein
MRLCLNFTRCFAFWAAFMLGAGSGLADVIETKSGARLVGTITKVEGSKIFLSTNFAGTLAVKKSEVASVQTEQVRFVHMADGKVLSGTVEPSSYGQVKVVGAGEPVEVPISQIAELWTPSAKDVAQPQWHYEAAGDLAGKSGNREQFSTVLSGRAKRVGVHDILQLYSSYRLQTTDKVTSADQFKIGMDYADNYSGRKSWYVRDESGFDRVKRIDLYSLAAGGAGYDFVKNQRQKLTGRSGLSYRYESYEDPNTPSIKSFGLDLGAHHEIKFSDSKMVNDITFVPAFSEFSNYHAIQESYFEMPLSMSGWKLRLGVSNDYTSVPGANVKKLDTTYFTRFVLNWQ